jgi:hypothetical protein
MPRLARRVRARTHSWRRKSPTESVERTASLVRRMLGRRTATHIDARIRRTMIVTASTYLPLFLATIIQGTR